MIRVIALALAALTLACSPRSAAEPAAAAQARAQVHPESGLEVVPLVVVSGAQRHAFRVEVAASPQDQARGLMFRTRLGPDEGMIFPTRTPQMRGFWMKNTPLPLDIIFIGEDRRIMNIAAQTTPYSLESVYSAAPAIAVLEIAGGRAAELGIEPGDRVDW